MRRLFFHEESIHEVSRRYFDAPYTHTYIRTSRNQYVPHFLKVGGIKKHTSITRVMLQATGIGSFVKGNQANLPLLLLKTDVSFTVMKDLNLLPM